MPGTPAYVRTSWLMPIGKGAPLPLSVPWMLTRNGTSRTSRASARSRSVVT